MPRPILAFLAASIACVAMQAATAPARPNIVFIVADDLGARDLGCTGSSFYRTPNLDGLARRSMRFTDAYAAAPVCSPTRASLLTGLYPARLHLTDWLPGRPDLASQRLARPAIADRLPAAQPTLASVLRNAGYATAHVGKWHLGGQGALPTDYGFDVNIGGDELGSPLSYTAPYRSNDRVIPGLGEAPDGEYLTDRLTSETIRFIEQNKDRPFYVQLWHYAVHTPLRAKQEVVAGFPKVSDRPGQQTNAIYAAMIASMDEGVGRILSTLDALHLRENTVVVFTSDNGGLCTLEGPNTPATGNGPFREGKGTLYEGGIRVPLIIDWPGVTMAGGTSSVPVCSVDIMATLCGIAGAAVPQATDGVSLVPVLKGDPAPVRPALYWHYPHYSNQGGRPAGAVRAGDFKLVEFLETGRRELFDLKNDPGEIRNLATDQPERVQELASLLQQWRTRVNAAAMKPNPAYHPHPPDAAGVIELPGCDADVHGTMLRFEPVPHKNTLGFWVDAADWAEWAFELPGPGTYTLEVTQGCGNGSGGSEVEWTVDDQTVRMTVQETGGFQKFVARDVGQITFRGAGRKTLAVRAKTKPGPAVMDVPKVRLKPVTGATGAGVGVPVGGAGSREKGTRPFHLGFTRWPADLTLEGVRVAQDFAHEHGDMVSVMFIGGIPWPESLDGTAYSKDVDSNLAYRPPAGKKLFLSISPLNRDRKDLAPYWGAKDNQPLPEAWRGRALNSPEVKKAFVAFVLRAVESMHPDFLAIGIESNVLLSHSRARWDQLKELHRATYEAVKAKHPALPVCFTTEVLHYKKLAADARGSDQEREVGDLMRHSDLFAASLYPHMSYDVPKPVPEDFLSFATAFGKPIAVAESGMTSRDIALKAYGVTLRGSESDQRQFTELLLRTAQRDRYEFVITFATTDFEKLCAKLPPPVDDLARIWAYTGMQTSELKAKPALAVWDAALSQEYRRP